MTEHEKSKNEQMSEHDRVEEIKKCIASASDLAGNGDPLICAYLDPDGVILLRSAGTRNETVGLATNFIVNMIMRMVMQDVGRSSIKAVPLEDISTNIVEDLIASLQKKDEDVH